MNDFAWDPDGRAGEWIPGRLGDFGTVGGNVPLGFECYVSIPNSADPQVASDGSIDPVDGGARLDALLDVLLRPDTDGPLHFALWTGYGFLDDPAGRSRSSSFLVGMPLRYTDDDGATGVPEAQAVPGVDPRAAAATAALFAEPTGGFQPRLSGFERPGFVHLAVPHRDYHLWSGKRADAQAFLGEQQSPTMFWAADHSWFVNSDLDSARTEIGGDSALLAPLLQPSWGGTSVRPTDPITAAWDTHPDANTVNTPPPTRPWWPFGRR